MQCFFIPLIFSKTGLPENNRGARERIMHVLLGLAQSDTVMVTQILSWGTTAFALNAL